MSIEVTSTIHLNVWNKLSDIIVLTPGASLVSVSYKGNKATAVILCESQDAANSIMTWIEKNADGGIFGSLISKLFGV